MQVATNLSSFKGEPAWISDRCRPMLRCCIPEPSGKIWDMVELSYLMGWLYRFRIPVMARMAGRLDFLSYGQLRAACTALKFNDGLRVRRAMLVR